MPALIDVIKAIVPEEEMTKLSLRYHSKFVYWPTDTIVVSSQGLRAQREYC